MDLQEAVDRFKEVLARSEDLVKVHREVGRLRAAAQATATTRGQRQEEVAINGAVVVLVVASWQSLVEDLTQAILDLSEPLAGSAISVATYRAVTGVARQGIGALNTPNPQNTRKLMVSAGFDPRPFWTWNQSGGAGAGAKVVTPADVDKQMGEWLKLRHLVAHGRAIEQMDVLEAVRAKRKEFAAKTPPQAVPTTWEPTIRLGDARRCIVFFRRVASRTATAIADHVDSKPPSW